MQCVAGQGPPRMGTRTTRMAHRALAAAATLLTLIALTGTALAAGTSTNFSVRRVQSLPTGAPVTVGPLGQVASAINYGGMAVGPVFFRPVNGTNEHSPLAFPGLQISSDFGASPQATRTTLHLPPGQLGNPYLPACTDTSSCPSTSKVGEITLNGQAGSIFNFNPANLPDPSQRTAPAAVALVVPGLSYIKTAPILVAPRGNGDYGLDSSTDLTGASAPITSLRIFQYGLVVQNLTDPLPALPYIFNPTECRTAVATGDTTFADGSTTHDSFTIMPRPAESGNAATDRAQLAGECARFAWDGVEPSGSGTQNNDKLRVTAFATVHGTDDGAVEQPDEYRFRFITPTRGGIPYQSHYKSITAVLPPGVAISAAAASGPGFTVCTPDQFAADAAAPAACPGASKVGDLKVLSPLLDGDRSTPVDVFKLAQDGCSGPAGNPCQNLITDAHLDPVGGDIWAGPQVEGHPNQFRIFGEITDGGITRVKLQGIATADEQTGQVTATFDNLPQLPVYDVEQRFFGGDHATLVNPDSCGQFTVGTRVQPWAAIHDDGSAAAAPAAATPSDGFTISGCTGPKPFAPSLSLLSDPLAAGADSALTTTITVPDGSQNLVSADVALPDGLVGVLGKIPLCARDRARAGTCGPESRIGSVDVVVGNGGSPAHTPGSVFFSAPAAPGELARITIVVPARVGPFDLGTTIVNELAVKLRQNGGSLGLDNVGADRLPTMLAGIPIRVRQISLRIDRPAFLRNPLTCAPLQGRGTFGSDAGRVVTIPAPYQATGGAGLGFTPQLSPVVGTAKQPAKAGPHPPLATVVTQPDHQGAIRKAVVKLPTGLSVNLLGLQSLCEPAAAVAETCPATTRVGSASATSPLLPAPLAGPVYVVRNPGGTYPKLSVQLHGTFDLRLEASTAADAGRLVTTLDNLPAAPVTRFELDIDGGPRGLLTTETTLCPKPVMNATFDAHSGQSRTVASPVRVVGACATSAASRARPKVSISVRRVARTPLVTLRVVRGSSSRNLRIVRLTLPKQLVASPRRAAQGITVRAGKRKVARRSWTLSRRGVLTVRRSAASITVTLRGGAVRAAKRLRSLAVRKRTLPRLTFAVRVADAKKKAYSYRVRVRPRR